MSNIFRISFAWQLKLTAIISSMSENLYLPRFLPDKNSGKKNRDIDFWCELNKLLGEGLYAPIIPPV